MTTVKPFSKKQVEDFFGADVVFAYGAADAGMLPREAFPEIAFIGRSNVGKSSLLNALLKKKIAHVSNTPGRTQQLNFFRLGDRAMLVDMPGYGYAKAPQANISSWGELIEHYLKERRSLKRLCLLIDSRHGVKDNDKEFLKMLNIFAVPFVVILTKADKISAKELAGVTAQTEAYVKKCASAWSTIFITSAEKNSGLDALRLFLAQALL